jgi:hypothetical protein
MRRKLLCTWEGEKCSFGTEDYVYLTVIQYLTLRRIERLELDPRR